MYWTFCPTFLISYLLYELVLQVVVEYILVAFGVEFVVYVGFDWYNDDMMVVARGILSRF